jgi:hypothetical protein
MAITKKQFSTLADLFDYYNSALFASELPECLMNLSRHGGARGFFVAGRWNDRKKNTVHEISLNPDTMNCADKKWHSTLVHEMVHLWEKVKGTASRRAYHNKKWAQKMEAVGLMPSNTGRLGGKKTGQRMTHYVIKEGLFDKAFSNIHQQSLINLKLPYKPELVSKIVKGASGIKVTYICSCENRVWGKSDLHIKCLICGQKYKPVRTKVQRI